MHFPSHSTTTDYCGKVCLAKNLLPALFCIVDNEKTFPWTFKHTF